MPVNAIPASTETRFVSVSASSSRHCFFRFMWFLFRVKFGEHDRCDKKQSAETRQVVKMIVNTFSLSDLSNDIALLKLNKKVEYNHAIRPVCLPKNDGKCYVAEQIKKHCTCNLSIVLLK